MRLCTVSKFNIDERQTTSFIGLPTPAAALVVLSLPLIMEYGTFETVHNLIQNQWVLLGITLLLSWLMNAEIPLFSLKFKDFSWKKNKVQFIFILMTLVLTVLFEFTAIPLVILGYVLLSIITNSFFKTEDDAV